MSAYARKLAMKKNSCSIFILSMCRFGLKKMSKASLSQINVFAAKMIKIYSNFFMMMPRKIDV